MRKLCIVSICVICLMMMSGCLAYRDDREFGDYYNTTKGLWSRPYGTYDYQFSIDSFGQTVGTSGVFLFFYGVIVTNPIGFCIHQVEKCTIAPLWDTIMLIPDLCYHSKYLEISGKEPVK